MRNGIVNANSPKEDIWGVLTGVWNEYDTGPDKKWHVIKTPFFVNLSGVFEAGRNELPIAPVRTCALAWTSKDNSGSVVLHVGDTGFTIPENAYCEVTMFGTTGGNDGH